MLAVVDLQPWNKNSNRGFEFSDAVIPACLKLINKAKKDNEYIVLVHYKGEGQILDKIEDAAIGYPRTIVVQKDCNDGSKHISQAFRALPKFPEFKEIRVCGVYTTWCVRETCRGLAKLFPNTPIKIILDACDCFESHSKIEKELIKMIENYDNISVVM